MLFSVMFKKINLSNNNNNFDKSNIKFLKIISIILALLILICLILFVLGVFKNFKKLSSNKDKNVPVLEFNEFKLFYPSKAQFINATLGNEDNLLLRYQLNGENVLLIINLRHKKIVKKISLLPDKEWKVK